MVVLNALGHYSFYNSDVDEPSGLSRSLLFPDYVAPPLNPESQQPFGGTSEDTQITQPLNAVERTNGYHISVPDLMSSQSEPSGQIDIAASLQVPFVAPRLDYAAECAEVSGMPSISKHYS